MNGSGLVEISAFHLRRLRRREKAAAIAYTLNGTAELKDAELPSWLAQLDFVARAEVVLFIGPAGSREIQR